MLIIQLEFLSGKMNLEFDPKKNITNLDRSMFLPKIHDLLIISKIVKNWQDVLLFRFGLKANIILHLKTGQQIKIKKRNTLRFVR